MPSLLRAPRMVVPAGTATSRPSMVSLTWSSTVTSSRRREHFERTEYGPGGGLPQAADRGVAHRGAHVLQELHVAGAAMAHREAMQDLDLAFGADAAGHALPARLLGKELRHQPRNLPHVDRVVEDDGCARADRQAQGAQHARRQWFVEVLERHEHPGRAAHQHRLQATTVWHAAG